ncbi:MAG TPA: hypothetical protein VG735_14345 [Caulobacterales bacterium]|nr:hypothetical protein [Caulobacterales bacterium]
MTTPVAPASTAPAVPLVGAVNAVSARNEVEVDYSGAPIDKAKLTEAKALRSLARKKDDFKNTICYRSSNSPAYVNQNGFYLTFCIQDDFVGPLTLHVQYHSDDWLFVQTYDIKVDDQVYNRQDEFERDNGVDGDGASIWEWVSRPIRRDEPQILRSIAAGKDTRIRFNGKTTTATEP